MDPVLTISKELVNSKTIYKIKGLALPSEGDRWESTLLHLVLASIRLMLVLMLVTHLELLQEIQKEKVALQGLDNTLTNLTTREKELP